MSEPVLDTRKLAAARLWAASRFPYLASALFASTAVPVAGLGGAAVDEWWRLYVDPEVVDKASIEVLGSLLVHHAGHLLRDHAGRARAVGVGPQSSREWGLAADAEINDDLVPSGLRLPGDPVLPQTLGFAPGQLAEEYFHGHGHDPGYDVDCGSGADSVARQWDRGGEEPGGLPPGERQMLRCQVAAQVMSHSREGTSRVPAAWRRWAEDMLEPKIDWRKVLAAEIRKGVGTVAGLVDYTYRRPSRRASASGNVILPALERPVPEIAVVCDTSGSMSEAQLSRVLAEVEGLLRGLGLSRPRVLAVDAAVQTVRRVSSARQVELLGGGGTDMGVGIAAAARLRPRPSVVVVLTDGRTPWPAEAPKGLVVVVGLLEDDGPRGALLEAPPAWARLVRIDAPAHAA